MTKWNLLAQIVRIRSGTVCTAPVCLRHRVTLGCSCSSEVGSIWLCWGVRCSRGGAGCAEKRNRVCWAGQAGVVRTEPWFEQFLVQGGSKRHHLTQWGLLCDLACCFFSITSKPLSPTPPTPMMCLMGVILLEAGAVIFKVRVLKRICFKDSFQELSLFVAAFTINWRSQRSLRPGNSGPDTEALNALIENTPS